MPRIGLDRDVIARAAMTLLDEGGLGAITARAIAERLGVRPSALYYHLPDMRGVLDELATMILRELLAEPLTQTEWEPLLRAVADRLRAGLKRHRDGARAFAGSRVTDDALLPGMEGPMRVLVGAGLPVDEAIWTLQSVLHYTVGFVIEEQHRLDDEPEYYTAAVRLARIDAETAPLTAQATMPMLAGADRQFAFGTDLLVEGVRRRIDRG